MTPAVVDLILDALTVIGCGFIIYCLLFDRES